jgi:sporulation protein YlmC with PRC-barrel domain
MGRVNNVLRDSWTGEISKFSVAAEGSESVVFYSPEDISESSDSLVRLKKASEDQSTAVEFGARVFDKNGELIGTVDYLIRDPLSGEVKRFKVKTGSALEAVFFGVSDISRSTPDEIKLKVVLEKTPAGS